MKQLLSTIRRFPLGRLAPALGAYCAVAASTAAGWAPAASETAFLAWLTGTVLLAVAIIDHRPALPSAMLVATAAWVLPPGASRGLAITALLLVAIAAAAWHQRARLTTAPVALPLALGLQILLRSEYLVGATPTAVCSILLPALLAAAALVWLARMHGSPWLPVIAASSIVIVGSLDSGLAVTFSTFAIARHVQGARRSPWMLGLAGVATALFLFWNPLATAIALAGAIAEGQGRLRWPVLAMAGIGGLLFASSSWSESLVAVYWLAIVVPVALLPRRPGVTWFAGIVLLVAGARYLPPGSTPAAALLLLASGLGPIDKFVQRFWSATLLAGTLVLACYPWLRLDPAWDAIAWIGLTPSWANALLVLAIFALIAVAGRRPRLILDGALALLAVALLAQLPRPSLSLIGYDPVNLGAGRQGVVIETDATPTRTVAIGASASNSLDLPANSTLATITLSDRSGASQVIELTKGEHLGEWAARRQDLRDRSELREPRPWVAWSVPGFFGRSFRSVHRLDSRLDIVSVQIDRRQDLGPDVGLRIDHLDLRP